MNYKHMKPSKDCPKLTELADAANNGAVNSYALIQSLAEAIKELSPGEVREHPAVKVVIGQISWLCLESAGPTAPALQAYHDWRNSCSGN